MKETRIPPRTLSHSTVLCCRSHNVWYYTHRTEQHEVFVYAFAISINNNFSFLSFCFFRCKTLPLSLFFVSHLCIRRRLSLHEYKFCCEHRTLTANIKIRSTFDIIQWTTLRKSHNGRDSLAHACLCVCQQSLCGVSVAPSTWDRRTIQFIHKVPTGFITNCHRSPSSHRSIA